MKIHMRHIAVVLSFFILMVATVPILGTQGNMSFSGADLKAGDGSFDHDQLSQVPLSGPYSPTGLGAPFTDVSTKFIVYPNGRVGLKGTLDYTSTEFPFNSTTANLLVTYSGGLLNLGVDSTVILPPAIEKQYPFNATEAALTITYSGGILNLEINGNTTLPPSVTSTFPLNATNLKVVGDYVANRLDGKITVDVVQGYAVNIDFTGNKTDLTLSGTVIVVFGIPIGRFVIQNSTVLDQIINQLKSTIPGEKGFVWNQTGGLLNVTNFDVSYVLQDNWGAEVTFKVDFHGDFVKAIAYLLYPIYKIDWTRLYPILDAAFSSVQSASFKLGYTHTDNRLNFQLTLVDKSKALIDDITRLLPKSWPPGTSPQLKSFVESFLNTTYASVSSAQVSLSYKNGKADLKATVTIEGDLNAELNYVKDLYFKYMEATYIPWQTTFINQTKIDISNFKLNAKLEGGSLSSTMEGLTLMPPIDPINATDFQLKRFFNLTAPQYPGQKEFPGKNQRLKITIEGGSDAMHTVTIFRPPTVPEPDSAAPSGTSMMWSNQTLSSLKDLVFKIGPLVPGPSTGTLKITTTPVSGEVFVNGTSWGMAPQNRTDVLIGTYNVSFGRVDRYYTPSWKLATVSENHETSVEGVYTPITGTLTIRTTPVNVEVFVNGTSWGIAPQSKAVQIGTYNVSFGPKEGYTTPANKIVTVNENQETTVEGAFQALPTTPLWLWALGVVLAAVAIAIGIVYIRRRKHQAPAEIKKP